MVTKGVSVSDVLLPDSLVKPNKVAKRPRGFNKVEDGFKQMMER
jgi:hypothetical protein